MYRLSPLVRNLLIINVVVFLLQLITQDMVTALLSLWPIGSQYFAPYQFFSYMFAHGGWMHILFNMFALASFGPILESYWGDKKFLIFYIVTGMGAGILYGAANYYIFPGAGGYMLGASGAIYGLLMAFGMTFPNLEIMLLFPPIPIKAKYMVFLMGFLTYAMDRSGSVAHLAHFGGAFVGFLLVTFWRGSGR